MQSAADALWRYTGELFIADGIDDEMAACGCGFDPAPLRDEWRRYVGRVFEQATLRMPPHETWTHEGGKQGTHTEHLGYLLAEMQVLHREFPGAAW